MYGLFYLLCCQHTDTIKYFKKHHSICEFFYSEIATFTPTKDKTMGMCSLLGPINGRNSGFGGLGVACWPLVPKFAGSNPAEAVGFLGAKKSSARLPSEGK